MTSSIDLKNREQIDALAAYACRHYGLPVRKGEVGYEPGRMYPSLYAQTHFLGELRGGDNGYCTRLVLMRGDDKIAVPVADVLEG